MTNLTKYYETANENVFIINSNRQALASVPKNLNNNIKIFLTFKDNSFQNMNDTDRNSLFYEIQEVSQKITDNSSSGIYITAFLNDQIINDDRENSYSTELNKIKNIVNCVYNKLLIDGQIKKGDVIKRLELVYTDSKYNGFINWLCLQNPKKYHAVSYQNIINDKKSENRNGVFINNNSASIFNEPNKQSTMMGMQSNMRPINESLSIGTPQNLPNFSKTLIKSTPNNHGNAAFIKWYTSVFILVICLIIGVVVSLILVN